MATSSIWAPSILNVNANIPVVIGTGAVLTSPGFVLDLEDLTRQDSYTQEPFNLLQYVSAIFDQSEKLTEGKDFWISGEQEITFLRQLSTTLSNITAIDYKIALPYPGYRVLGDYDNGPWVLNTHVQVLSKDGILYKLKDTVTVFPLITANDWVVDEEFFEELLDSSGSLFSGFLLPENFGAIGDGITNDTAALQACLTAAAGIGVNLTKNYKITSTLTVPANTPVFLAGSVDMTGCPNSAPAFSVAGTEGTAYALTVDAVVNALTATISSANLTASGIVAGDWVRVSSDGIFDPARTSSKIGEIIRVESIDSGTGVITFEAPLVDGYLTADVATISKINFIQGVRFGGGGTIFSDNVTTKLHKAIYVNLALSPYLGPLNYKKISDRAIWLQDSILASVVDPYFEDFLASSTGYGISVISACQDVIVSGLRSYKVRHAFSTNNSSTSKGIPRRIIVDGFNVDVSARASGGSGGDAMDTHAAAEWIHFSNGTVRGSTSNGVNIECPNASVSNVKIYNAATHGISLINFSGRPSAYEVSDSYAENCGTDGIRIGPNNAKISSIRISNCEAKVTGSQGLNVLGNTTHAIDSCVVAGMTSTAASSSLAGINIANIDHGEISGVSVIDPTNVAAFFLRLRDCKRLSVDGVTGRLPASSTGGFVSLSSGTSGATSNVTLSGVNGNSPSAVSSRGILLDANCQNVTIGQACDLSAATTPISWNSGTGHRGGFLRGSVTYDPPSVAAGAETTTTVTVTGAALGDKAEVTFSLSLGGLWITAEVTAANTVTVRLRNFTGAAIDIASGTLRVQVYKI